MKATKYIILAIVALSMMACTDFFSNESPSAETPDKVFSNAALTEQAVCGAYQELARDKGYTNRLACGYVGLNTDCEWSNWSTGSDDRAKLVTYNIPISLSAIANQTGSDSWSYMSIIIERCNNIIDGIQQYGDTINDQALRYYLGEAYLLRSFVYLELIKYWGDVPARFVSLTKDPASINAPKTDRNEIFAHLRGDLKEAARLMPWSNDDGVPVPCRNNVGRGNRAAALALLARADMMYAGKAVRPLTLTDPEGYSVRPNFEDNQLRKEVYEEVMWACAEIIKHEDKLAKDFSTPFKQICADVIEYDRMEHIWTIPFANGARGQVMGFNAPKVGSSEITKLAGKLQGIGTGAKSNGNLCITPYLLYQFDPEDTRRAVTCVQGQWVYDSKSIAGLPAGERAYIKAGNAKNFWLAKFRFEWMKRASMGDDGVDFPILRYADVLLMFAEAAIGSNMDVTPTNSTGLDPLEQLNKVRRRAHLDDASTLDFETIKTERAKEFCGEYIRKWDLMRWGILKQEVLKAEAFCRSFMEDESQVLVAELNGKTIEVSSRYWYKLRKVDEYSQFPDSITVWEIDSIYGLCPGETSPSEYMTKSNGWTEKKAIYGSDEKGWDMAKSSYPFYINVENLESRQYWPIFPHYITASNGNLWNNYGY